MMAGYLFFSYLYHISTGLLELVRLQNFKFNLPLEKFLYEGKRRDSGGKKS